jgi:hypothetical protein
VPTSKNLSFLFYSFALTFLLINTGCSTMGAKPEASVGNMPSQGPVGKTFKKNSAKFAACARDSVTIQTGSTQHIQIEFQISEKGQVLKAATSRMSEPDPDLHDCILRVVRKMEFPPTPDHKTRRLTYPLTLRPE